MKSYRAYVSAPAGHFLIGGVNQHESSRMETREMCHNWIEMVTSVNNALGRIVAGWGVWPEDEAPEILEAEI